MKVRVGRPSEAICTPVLDGGHWTEYGAPMQSTLSAKPGDDPCDAVVVAPDAIRVVPSDDELSDLLRHVARYRSDTQTETTADFKPDSTVPSIDAVFRPAPANDVRGSRDRRPMAARVARAVIALLLGACISLAAVAWKSYGEAAKRTIAALTTQFVASSSQPEQPALAAQSAPPAVQADAANASSPQPAALTHSAPNAVPPSAELSADLRAVAPVHVARSRNLETGGRRAQGRHGAAQGQPATSGSRRSQS